jgi:hypothetical protein
VDGGEVRGGGEAEDEVPKGEEHACESEIKAEGESACEKESCDKEDFKTSEEEKEIVL